MPNTIRTISDYAEGLYRDKGSRFLAFAHPVNSEDEVRTLLDKYKKDYFDARHVCYAYRLGEEGETYKVSDDGEPSGTAGRPILGQLRSAEVTNVLVVVVRYFGGILLGTGGLIVAYKEATQDALANTTIIERPILLHRSLRFPYEEMNRVMRTLKDINAHILSQGWEDGMSTIECEIEKQYAERI